MKNQWNMVAMALALVVWIPVGTVLAERGDDGDYPLPDDFSGVYAIQVTAVEPVDDGRAAVTVLKLQQATPPDGVVAWSKLTGEMAGYTFVKGEIEGANPTGAEFELKFRNATGGKVELEGVLVLTDGTLKLYAEWEEGDVETRVAGHMQND